MYEHNKKGWRWLNGAEGNRESKELRRLNDGKIRYDYGGPESSKQWRSECCAVRA